MLMQLSLENYVDIDVDADGCSPSPYSSIIPFFWKQCPGIFKSLSHAIVGKDASTHPLSLSLSLPYSTHTRNSPSRQWRGDHHLCRRHHGDHYLCIDADVVTER
ncbi:hypothetical protein GW17_00007008 [Ensete ventricosum]|nr:hypothetical protein GW17_00007008 [Ensete ventricosum]